MFPSLMCYLNSEAARPREFLTRLLARLLTRCVARFLTRVFQVRFATFRVRCLEFRVRCLQFHAMYNQHCQHHDHHHHYNYYVTFLVVAECSYSWATNSLFGALSSNKSQCSTLKNIMKQFENLGKPTENNGGGVPLLFSLSFLKCPAFFSLVFSLGAEWGGPVEGRTL